MKYLDDACANHPEVRERVEALLRAHSEAGGFFGGQPAATEIQPITEKPGTQIGPYKLLQQLGEGGMGVVYMAEQKEPVKRRVALKIIKPGMDTRQVIARFEAERQALAMMDHPNIAKVLDAGATESGRPYFVMELVNGLPVTKYCDEQHLTPKERLELFVPICQAVQHAHQKGIIHRDLKPSNILVALYDGQPVPKVIDFGVAKATSQTLTEKTIFTQLGQVVGTLEYMSPEQAQRNQLDIDTRSDIYSLGVVLYELLTGETPFDRARLRSAVFDEMLRIIREEEPPRPSTKLSGSAALPSIAANRHIEPKRLSVLVRGELDWIVMKALEKDRGRRYETASKFAEDVQHYLNDEAVIACPPSRTYQFRKFARRNKAKLVTGSLLAAAVLVTVGGIGWAVRDRAAQRAEVARERTQRQERINTQLDLLIADVDRLCQEGKWADALAMTRQAEVWLASGDASPTVAENVRVLLSELEFVARLDEIRMEAAAWTDDGFDNAGAVAGYAEAFRAFGVDLTSSQVAIARLNQHPRIVLPVAAALDDFVAAYRKSENSEDSRNDWIAIVETSCGIDSDPLRTELRSMWGQRVTPKVQEALRELAEAFDARAQGHQSASVLGDTLARCELPDLREQILRYAQQAFPGDYWLNLELGNILHGNNQSTEAARFYSAALAAQPDNNAALNNLGNALLDQGKLDEAIACYLKAIDIDPKFVYAHNNLGRALRQQGKLEAAIDSFRRAIELNSKYANSFNNLGNTLQDQGKLDEAIACYRKAIDIDRNSVIGHNNLGSVLQDQGKLDEAIACFEKALAIDQNDANAHNHLGNALLAQDRQDEAIACYLKAIEIDATLAAPYYNLGNVYRAEGRVDEAERRYRKTIELDPNCSPAYANLGALLAEQGKPDEAIAACRKAIEIDANEASTHNIKILGSNETFAHNVLGGLLLEQGLQEEAISLFRRAIELNPSQATAHYNLGQVLKAKGKLDEANACFETAIACDREAIAIDPERAEQHFGLGRALAEQGELNEAVACYRKAIEIDPERAEQHFHLGLALYQQEQLDEAIVCYREAIAIDPSTSDYHNNLGNVHLKQDNLDEAIARYRKAIELDANNAMAHQNLGVALRKKGLLDEAEHSYQRAGELNSNLVEVFIGWGALLGDDKRNYIAAQEVFLRGLSVDSRNEKILFNLGIVCVKQQKYEEAIHWFEKALEINPDNIQTQLSLGGALHDRGLLDESIACYRKALEIDPKFVRGYVGIGNVLQDQKQLDAAIDCYRTGIKLVPQEEKETLATLYRLLGDALRESGDAVEAKIAYTKAVELRVDGAGPHLEIGRFLLAQNRSGEAIVIFEQAVEFFEQRWDENPDDAALKQSLLTSLASLAKSHLASGDLETHQAICRRLVEIFPQPEERRVADWGHLGQWLVQAGQYVDGRTALEKVIELRGDSGPSLAGGPRWWYLAMSLARTDEPERAREIYEQLAKLTEEASRHSATMQNLQANTAEVLRIEIKND